MIPLNTWNTIVIKKAVALEEARQLYTEHKVKIIEEVSVPLSDHYGVPIKFRFD